MIFMEKLKIQDQKITLVDQVEMRLMEYFNEHNLRPGSALPNEMELAESLGVARTVLREALSRLKMVGMIESRTRRGMVLSSPSLMGSIRRVVNPLWMTEETLLDMLEFRIVLEIGCIGSIFRNVTPDDIKELENIVSVGEKLGDNKYAPVSEYRFHTKLYEITGNKTISEFQLIIHPLFDFIRDRYKDYFEPIARRMEEEKTSVSHEQLLECIRNNDEDGYYKAIRQHFKLYTDYMKVRKTQLKGKDNEY